MFWDMDTFFSVRYHSFFFFNDTATTEIYTLSLHDALPICPPPGDAPLLPPGRARRPGTGVGDVVALLPGPALVRPPLSALIAAALDEVQEGRVGDRRAADPEPLQVG